MGGCAKARERLAPERVEVLAQRLDCFRIDLVDASRSRLAVEHEPRLLEHLEMLRDSGAADRKLARELTDRRGILGEAFEDLAPAWVPERLQRSLLVSSHER